MVINRGILLLILLLLSVAGDTTSQNLKGSTPGQGQQSIQIIPSSSSISMKPRQVPDRAATYSPESPMEGYAAFSVNVQSILPFWGALLDVILLEGPGGSVPHDRLLVRTAQTGEEFMPLDHPVPIVVGNYKQPVVDVPVELLFRPTWGDPPGNYHFQLSLDPSIPESRGSEVLQSSGSIPQPLGAGPGIGGEFPNADMIYIDLSTMELGFDIDRGMGTYEAEEDILFWIWTNADAWHIDCQATSLQSDEDEIPIERLAWERLDEYGNVIETGNFSNQNTVLSGHTPVVEFRAALRVSVTVTMSDIAGSYSGQLSLIGSVD